MASNLPQPLELLETLRIIFAFLDPKALVACAQVNSLWADEATDILWHHPPPHALLPLITSGRAQVYANKIASLDISSREPDGIDFLHAFQHLLFPRLRAMFALPTDLVSEQRLLPYLQPTLKRFSIYIPFRVKDWSSSVDEAIYAVLTQLLASCPFLQEITLCSLSLNRNRLLTLLERASFLRSVELMEGSEIEYETIRNLAALSNLTRLRIDSIFPEEYTLVLGEYFARLEVESFTPFASLQYLHICVEEDAIICFARQLRYLEILEITLLDSSKTLLSTLARFSGLRELQVQFNAPGSAIKALDLISLASSCRGLTKLSLCGIGGYGDSNTRFHPGTLDASDIKDVDIRTVSSLLPSLEGLILDCWGKLSVLSLHHLGRNCPRLQYCILIPCGVEVSALLEYSPLGQTRTSTTSSNGPDASSPMLATHEPGVADLEMSSAVMQGSEGPPLATREEIRDVRPLFPKLEHLTVREILNCKNLATPFVVSRLCSEAPRLEGISIERRWDQFAADLDDALDKLRGDPLFPRNV